MNQYVQQLSKLNTKTTIKLEVGDWMMVPELLKKRTEWPLTKITDIMIGTDRVVRSV